MAWFVVASGFLLMLGGGASLLMGFDIVMTERGSAMTIGGVIALSGGVVSVGIGFALLKLQQILRSLAARADKAPRAAPQDRPVVPIQADPPAPKPVPGMGGMAAGAALGAAGAAIASAAISPPDPPPARRGLAEAPPEEAPAPPLAEIRAEDVAPEPAATPDATPFRFEPPARPSAPPDLEAELTRALAETDEPPPRRSFADGLNDLLAREPEPRAAAGPEVQAPTASEPRFEETLTAGAPGDEPVSGPDAEADIVRDSVEDRSEEGEVVAEDADDAGDADARPEAPTEPDSDERDFRLPHTGFAQFAESGAGRPVSPPEPAPPPPQPVLGSYSVGGRTYRMFADGSVEAVSEQGVERFASMDELRKHLAGT